MTLSDRVVTLFAEVAIAAGVYEAQHGKPPRFAVLPPAAAAALTEYLKTSDDLVGCTAGPLSRTSRNVSKRAMVSGLEVKVVAFARSPFVC